AVEVAAARVRLGHHRRGCEPVRVLRPGAPGPRVARPGGRRPDGLAGRRRPRGRFLSRPQFPAARSSHSYKPGRPGAWQGGRMAETQTRAATYVWPTLLYTDARAA